MVKTIEEVALRSEANCDNGKYWSLRKGYVDGAKSRAMSSKARTDTVVSMTIGAQPTWGGEIYYINSLGLHN